MKEEGQSDTNDRRRREGGEGEWFYMLLTYSYTNPPAPIISPVSILIPCFLLELSRVTLAIPGKQLPPLVAWLNFQSDPSGSHGHLIITSYKLVPIHLRPHSPALTTHAVPIKLNKEEMVGE